MKHFVLSHPSIRFFQRLIIPQTLLFQPSNSFLFLFLTNISRSLFSDGRHRSIKHLLFYCVHFFADAHIITLRISICFLLWCQFEKENQNGEVCVDGLGEFEFDVYSTSSVDFFPRTFTLMWALCSHVSSRFFFFLFLISNRALVLPSEQNRKKIKTKKRKSLIEIYTHWLKPRIDPCQASDANRVNIFPMIHFRFFCFPSLWHKTNERRCWVEWVDSGMCPWRNINREKKEMWALRRIFKVKSLELCFISA